MGSSGMEPANLEETEKRHRETILQLKREHSAEITKVQEEMKDSYDYLLRSIPIPEPTQSDENLSNLPRVSEGTTNDPSWQYGEDDWYEYGYWDDDGYWYWYDDYEFEYATK